MALKPNTPPPSDTPILPITHAITRIVELESRKVASMMVSGIVNTGTFTGVYGGTHDTCGIAVGVLAQLRKVKKDQPIQVVITAFWCKELCTHCQQLLNELKPGLAKLTTDV